MDVRVGPESWCFWIVVLEKILESPLDCKEIKLINPKGSQLWIFIWRTDAEAETLILWAPDAKKWLIWKDPNSGKEWRWEEKGTTEDEMVGWHHQLNVHEFWANFGRWWWTQKSGMLQSKRSQRVRHDSDWTTIIMEVLFLVFQGLSTLFSTVAVSIYNPTKNAGEFPFLQTLSNIYCL